MKVMVLSDIHGDASALTRLLRLFDEEHFDRLFLLGDIGYGVLPLLDGYEELITAVCGNNDDARVVENASFPMPILNRAGAFGKIFVLTHGHIYDEYSYRGYYDVLLLGHTHHPMMMRRSEGRIIANPGSISRPRSSIASYIVIDEIGMHLSSVDTMSEYQLLKF